MFKFFRTARAAAYVEKMIRSFLIPATQALSGPVSNSIYEDPYVLGYLMALAAAGAALANNTFAGGKLSDADCTNVAMRGLEHAVGASGRTAVSNMLKYENDDHFLLGVDRGHRMIGVMLGKLTAEYDPEVAGAFEAATHLQKMLPGASENELAAQHLHISYFNEYIARKSR